MVTKVTVWILVEEMTALKGVFLLNTYPFKEKWPRIQEMIPGHEILK
jgi:hypothetical protein